MGWKSTVGTLSCFELCVMLLLLGKNNGGSGSINPELSVLAKGERRGEDTGCGQFSRVERERTDITIASVVDNPFKQY